MEQFLSGKKALVTGGSQGIGRVICEMLAKCGCEVFVNCAHHPEKAEAVATDIRAAGGKAAVDICDVTDEAAVNAMIARLQPLDILVNNARMDPWLRDPKASEGEWFDKVMAVNLKGAFLCSWAFFGPAKARGWGRIVNISSVRAFRPAEMNTIAYAASKSGMHSLTRAFADNGAKFGVTANSICPGVVLTENFAKRISPEKQAMEQAAVPLGRGATSEEIADAVLFVIRNGYVTGETVNINGGMYYEP